MYPLIPGNFLARSLLLEESSGVFASSNAFFRAWLYNNFYELSAVQVALISP